jgi:hypothetical protein
LAARLLLSVSSKAVTPVDSYKPAGLQETLQVISGKAVTQAIKRQEQHGCMALNKVEAERL